MDPIRNKLPLTTYFAIILGGLLSGGFCPGGFCPGGFLSRAFDRLPFLNSFDMVDHSILLAKLKFYGIRGMTYNLICRFLTDRVQFVNNDWTNSSTTA